ncbi:hypothetical protein Tco_1143145 [Tanacetum coccineum]
MGRILIPSTLAQFFPPGRPAKLCNDILIFQQHLGESLSKAWTRFKDLIQKVPHHGVDLSLKVQIFYAHVTPVTRRTKIYPEIDQASGKLRDRNSKESWALLEDLVLYDNENVSSTSDRRLIELENQVQRLMEAHLALTQPTQVKKITTSCEICSGPHDTEYCMEDPEQAFVEYASLRTDEAGGKWSTFKPEQNNLGDTYNPSWKSHLNLSSINAITICLKQPNEPQNNELEREDREERSNPENIDTTLPAPHDPSISFITEKVRKLNSFLESSSWVPQSSDTEIVCTKEVNGEVMFIDIIRKNDDSLEEGPEDEGSATIEELEVEYFDTFPTRSELAYHMYLMRGLIPSLFLRNPIITEGCPSNLKIPCYIGHVHVEKAYIDLNCPLNVMTRMLYHWSMRRNSTLGKILIDE